MIDELFFTGLGILVGLFLVKKRVATWDNVESTYGKAKAMVKKKKPTDPTDPTDPTNTTIET